MARKPRYEMPVEYTIDDVFAFVYDALSEFGHCDGWGATESIRVHTEWIQAGRPLPMAPFIHRRANMGPEPRADQTP